MILFKMFAHTKLCKHQLNTQHIFSMNSFVNIKPIDKLTLATFYLRKKFVRVQITTNNSIKCISSGQWRRRNRSIDMDNLSVQSRQLLWCAHANCNTEMAPIMASISLTYLLSLLCGSHQLKNATLCQTRKCYVPASIAGGNFVWFFLCFCP